MSRKKAPTPPKAYFEALQKIFELESAVLTAALPHMGERGRNDEERCRAYLRRVLPKAFSIGTGFVVCSDPSVETKHQQIDVVIYDEVENAPLHSELAAAVFPVEMVYGVVEVKGTLQPRDLDDIVDNVAEFRRLGRNKWIRQFGATPKATGAVVTTADVKVERPGRSFVFAYDATWKTAQAFQKAVQRALEKNRATHLHGMVVVQKNWYVYQVAYAEPVRLKFFSNNALLRFTRNMLISLQTSPIGPAALDRYFKLDEYAVEGVERGLPQAPQGR
jgi:hypothetical protein